MLWTITYLFLCHYDNSKKLIFQAFHCNREVDNGSLGTNFRAVGWVAKLSSDVQSETVHYIHLLVTNFHLQDTSSSHKIS